MQEIIIEILIFDRMISLIKSYFNNNPLLPTGMSPGGWPTNDISTEFKIQWNLLSFSWAHRNFAHVTTVTLSWCVQNFVVIGWALFETKHCKFWSNFEFDRNIVSETGAWQSLKIYYYPGDQPLVTASFLQVIGRSWENDNSWLIYFETQELDDIVWLEIHMPCTDLFISFVTERGWLI